MKLDYGMHWIRRLSMLLLKFNYRSFHSSNVIFRFFFAVIFFICSSRVCFFDVYLISEYCTRTCDQRLKCELLLLKIFPRWCVFMLSNGNDLLLLWVYYSSLYLAYDINMLIYHYLWSKIQNLDYCYLKSSEDIVCF